MADLLKEVLGHFFEGVQNVVLCHKRHFAVYLGEFGLAVGTQVFVAETLCYLEVAIHSCYHEQLLQRLRTLRQCVKLTGVHA